MCKMINAATLIETIKETFAEWRYHSEEIRRLDAIIGDGDMGVTVELASKAMIDYLDDAVEEDIGNLLMNCGIRINRASPSTFGTLLASAFMEGGRAVLGLKEIQFKNLFCVGRGALEAIKKRGKAEAGDKTMIDALAPAVQAFQNAVTSCVDDRAAIESSIRAAEVGMKNTVQMKAKFSRASYRQDGGIGIKDAGATAMYYLIEAFGHSLAARL